MPYSDEEVLAEIRRVAESVDSDGGPTLQQFKDHGEMSHTTVIRRFDSWNDAVEHAGFDARSPEEPIPTEDLLAELHRLRDELGCVPIGEQLNERGEYSRSTYQKRFGSWSEALEAAFDDTSEAGAQIPTADLLEELRRVADEHGSPPRFADMVAHGEYSTGAYVTRFGSWNAAVEEAGIEPRTSSRISTDDLLADLHRLRDELGERPTSDDIRSEGRYGLATYQRRFGSWSEALAAAFEDDATDPS